MNSTAAIFGEYCLRRDMAKLGYVSSIDELDCFTAECFAIINSEIAKEQEKAQKKLQNKGRRR